MSVVALVLAAGRGERLGAEFSKAFAPLAGKAILVHSIAALAEASCIDRIVPVIAEADRRRWLALHRHLAAIGKLEEAVIGGAERQDSMAAGLASLPPGVTHVAVHDAARPLVRPDAVDRVVQAALRDGAAILAAPVRDTIKRVQDGRVVETPNRSECVAAQTPQVFAIEILREALTKAALESHTGTDDAQLVEALGIPVTVVAGDVDNFKVTYPGDMALAEQILGRRGPWGAGG
jgi:2-C-methyl-D-erythritol 4-phosphate cytidylyltransferase